MASPISGTINIIAKVIGGAALGAGRLVGPAAGASGQGAGVAANTGVRAGAGWVQARNALGQFTTGRVPAGPGVAANTGVRAGAGWVQARNALGQFTTGRMPAGGPFTGPFAATSVTKGSGPKSGGSGLSLLKNKFDDFVGYQKDSLKVLGRLAGPLAIGGILAQSKIGNAVIGTIGQLLSALVDVILAPLVPILIPVLKFLARMVSSVATFFADVQSGGWVHAIIKLFKEAIFKGDWAAIAAVVVSGIAAIFATGKFIELIKGAISFTKDAWDDIAKFIRDAIKFADGVWDKLVDPIWSAIKNISQSLWNTLVDPILSAIKNISQSLWNTLVDPILNAIKNISQSLWNTLVDPILNAIKNIAQPIWDTIASAVAKAVKFTEDAWKPVIDAIASSASKIPVGGGVALTGWGLVIAAIVAGIAGMFIVWNKSGYNDTPGNFFNDPYKRQQFLEELFLWPFLKMNSDKYNYVPGMSGSGKTAPTMTGNNYTINFYGSVGGDYSNVGSQIKDGIDNKMRSV